MGAAEFMNEQTIEMLKKAGIDFDQTVKRFMGNTGLYAKFLTIFLDDDTFGKIAPAFEKNDFDEALATSHTLKGVSGNLGMTRLYKACSDTVALIRAGEQDKAKQSFAELKSAYDEIHAVIKDAAAKGM